MQDNPVEKKWSLYQGERYVELRCTEGIHNKIYVIIKKRSNGDYKVMSYWGKIGAKPASTEKFSGTSSGCDKAIMKLMKEKMTPHGKDGNYYRKVDDLTYEDVHNIKSSRTEALEIQISQFLSLKDGAILTEVGGNTFVSYLEV